MNPQSAANRCQKTAGPLFPEQATNVDRDTWLTPRWILKELGVFDLDPCASKMNPTWVPASRSFTKQANGLIQPWEGRVFMNPPFSETARWLLRHADHGLGISLVPASPESEVWRKVVWPRAKSILLLHGRPRFCNPDGTQTTGRPLRGIVLIAWSDDDAEILRSSALSGVLLEHWGCR